MKDFDFKKSFIENHIFSIWRKILSLLNILLQGNCSKKKNKKKIAVCDLHATVMQTICPSSIFT